MSPDKELLAAAGRLAIRARRLERAAASISRRCLRRAQRIARSSSSFSDRRRVTETDAVPEPPNSLTALQTMRRSRCVGTSA
eukprot:CAMPEP_0115829324 /NCGR_PEP_ID=MMETSP0287-20121206/1039_1 /TAXON_ID=412157 /ORGANISM="Chrysochromulina rotalis, Strain UIO044" /LENGTH=81 /DNA_ID=CAMNT_0003282585 /DNA_START=384 /DNA_END=629 /DNA_ORIENTATION=-